MAGNNTRVYLRILASTFSLVFAFIITQAFLQWMVYDFAMSFNYASKYGYNDVIVPMDFRLWTRLRVFVVDIFPPIICLVMGLVLFQAMRKQEDTWGIVQLVFYWLMVCLVNTCLSQMAISPLGIADPHSVFYETFARMVGWGRAPGLLALVLATIAVLASIGFGYFLSIQTIKLSYSQKLVGDNAGKNRVILLIYLLPLFLAAWPLLLLSKGFVTFRHGAILLNLLLFPMGMFLRNSVGPYRVKFKKINDGNAIPFLELGLGISAWCVIYFFFR